MAMNANHDPERSRRYTEQLGGVLQAIRRWRPPQKWRESWPFPARPLEAIPNDVVTEPPRTPTAEGRYL
jgi:hypothetical protein